MFASGLYTGIHTCVQEPNILSHTQICVSDVGDIYIYDVGDITHMYITEEERDIQPIHFTYS